MYKFSIGYSCRRKDFNKIFFSIYLIFLIFAILEKLHFVEKLCQFYLGLHVNNSFEENLLYEYHIFN